MGPGVLDWVEQRRGLVPQVDRLELGETGGEPIVELWQTGG